MLKIFKAYKLYKDYPFQKTGSIEFYQAETMEDAVSQLLYTRQLTDGNAHLGPTNQVVYSQEYVWVMMKGKNV